MSTKIRKTESEISEAAKKYFEEVINYTDRGLVESTFAETDFYNGYMKAQNDMWANLKLLINKTI